MRVGQVTLLCQIGGVPPELVRKNTELFAREVMLTPPDSQEELEKGARGSVPPALRHSSLR